MLSSEVFFDLNCNDNVYTKIINSINYQSKNICRSFNTIYLFQ